MRNLLPDRMTELERDFIRQAVGQGAFAKNAVQRFLKRLHWHLAVDQRGVFAMTTQGPSTVIKTTTPQVNGIVPPIQIADTAFTTTRASGTTASQNIGYGCTSFQAMVYMKTLVVGANTGVMQGPVASLEVADVTGMTTNLTTLDTKVFQNIASATQVQLIRLWGFTPVASKQFVRVVVDPTGMGAGSSGTFDCLIMAEP
jgi:hypothetical protein